MQLRWPWFCVLQSSPQGFSMICSMTYLEDDVQDAVEQRIEATDQGAECHGL
jgi:hypothetical protein